jgi:hypothetical protein
LRRWMEDLMAKYVSFPRADLSSLKWQKCRTPM